ncbi:MAG: ATP-binding protein [Pseudomonadota bacterium]
MKKPAFGLSTQLTLLTVVLILVSQAINAAILVQVERDLRAKRFQAVTAERLTQAVRLIDEPSGRGRIIMRRLNARIFPQPPDEGRPEPVMEQAFRAALDEADLGAREVVVRTLPEDDRRPSVVVGLKLPNDRWLHLRQPLPRSAGVPWRAILIQTIILTLVLLLPAVWIGRVVATPLRQLTASADGFLTGKDAPPLPSAGPADVQALCEAFSALQQRILAALEEKTMMLGSIGHDLRTPLASLRIRVESVDDDKLREEMTQSIEMLSETLDDVLAFSKSTSREAVEETRTDALVRNLELSYTSDQLTVGEVQALSLQCSPQAVLRALRNIVDNAVRYAGRAELSVMRQGGSVLFEVADRGPGVDPDALEQMQRPFTRAEGSRSRETGGAGLGLAIARAVAQAHGGALTLANREGGGLSVMLSLPLVRAETADVP